MTKSHSKITSDITMEACAWIAQIEGNRLTHEDINAFKEWMARSPAHREEIRKLAYLSRELNVLTEMAPALKDAAKKHRNALINKTKYNIFSRLLKNPVITMSIILIAFMATWFIVHTPTAPENLLITTEIGHYKEVSLSDGTVLKLNTATEIFVKYNKETREVHLLKGEAYFQVAHNPNRPFFVHAGKKVVRAVGTAFAVSLLPKKFEVTVTEGRIELNNEDFKTAKLDPKTQTLEKTPLLLDAGESIAYKDSSQDSEIKSISQREITRKLSWQEGLLDFSETPLAEVIEDLSRYTELQIEITDPELRSLKFGGIFRTNELDALFEALQTTFDIDVERQPNNTIRLSHNHQRNNKI